MRRKLPQTFIDELIDFEQAYLAEEILFGSQAFLESQQDGRQRAVRSYKPLRKMARSLISAAQMATCLNVLSRGGGEVKGRSVPLNGWIGTMIPESEKSKF
ncbi:MAG: hypothetical protein PVG14_05150 [Anaerolineales bacterium]